MPDSPEKKVRTFRRGIVGTLFGLIHVLAGFFSFLWSLARISIIGHKVIFDYGTAMAVFNYSYEATSLVLWASGIGILRGKLWGRIVAALWAVLVIFFHTAIYFTRKKYWGPLAPAPGWGDYAPICYAALLLAVLAAWPFLKKGWARVRPLAAGKFSWKGSGAPEGRSPVTNFLINFRNNVLNIKSLIWKRK